MKKILFLFLFGLITNSLLAQFSYVEILPTYHNLRFKRVDEGTQNLALNELRLNFSYTNRLIRRVGVGVILSLPAYSSFNANHSGSGTTGELVYFENEAGELNSNIGGNGKYEHDLQNNYSLSFYPRVYLNNEWGFYLDLRLNVMRFSEQFTYTRSAITADNGLPALDAASINYDESFTNIGYGFKLGAESLIGERIFFSYGLIVDFCNFDKIDGFEYLIPFERGPSNYNRAQIKSALSGFDISWQFGYGIGYYF